MPSYKRVRLASPSGNATLEEPNTSAERAEADVEAEQHDRLLSSDETDQPDDGHLRPASRRGRWLVVGILAVSAVAILAVIGIVFRFFLLNQSTTGQSSEQHEAEPGSTSSSFDFRRPPSDYVLDPTWDFEAQPQVRSFRWTIKNAVANPDGVFRPMVMINGKFPGELIRCNEGDTIVVDVENLSANATSIHWHGIFQNGTNWMDGTPGVTQCPIPPGRNYRYRFTVAGQAGTYFYHAHLAGQASDGLVGPIVIHSRQDGSRQQLPYVSDRVVMLQDWYHDLSDGLLRASLSPGSESSPVPDSSLINGINSVDCSVVPAARRCDNSSAIIPTLSVAPNENHRLRILNVGAFAWFEVTVDHHPSLPVSEIDGTDIEITPEKSIIVGPGQRYSVILSANQTGAEAFWFRARMLKHCFAENIHPERGAPEAKAVLHYQTASTPGGGGHVQPTTENDSGVFALECKDMHNGPYRPVPASPAPEFAHHSWYFRVNLEIGAWQLERGFLNQSTLRLNLAAPALHRVVDGLAANNQSFRSSGVNRDAFDAAHELVISSNGVEVVDIILQNFDEGNHPFHLHGTQMYVLASGHAYFPGYEALGLKVDGKGLLNPTNNTIIANPLRRDVATVEGFGWLLVRFVADNPGLWLFHCHMLWHGEAGMGMMFSSRMDMLERWSTPEENKALCQVSIEELEKGSTPKDEDFYGTSEK